MRTFKGLLLYLAVAFLASAFQPVAVFSFQVPNSSMEPGIVRGERIFVEPLRGSSEPLSIGQIVVFRVPGDSDDLLLKRIVGVPGDEIAIRDKKLMRNGGDVAEPFVKHVDPRIYRPGDDPSMVKRDQLSPVVLPAGHLFLLGDNRDQSYDSRNFGSVPATAVVGKVR